MLVVRLLLVIVLNFRFGNCAAGREVELDKGWTLQNQNGSYSYTNIIIPSGVYSTIQAATPNSDILKSYNDIKLRWVGYDNWTYALDFDSPEEDCSFVNIVFHGIDTIATIKLNGEIIGETNNMFVRYTYSVKHLLNAKLSTNRLEVIIKSPIYEAKNLASKYPHTPPECPPERYNGECHMNFLRKMQASFGWDWGLAAPSMGLWKMVTLEIYDVAIIRDVDVVVSLKDDQWSMQVKVYLETSIEEPIYGELTMYAVDLIDVPVKISLDENPLNPSHPVIVFEKKIPKENVKMWWPNGYGEPYLYHLHFTWNGRLSMGYNPRLYSVWQKSIRIGFRTIELIQNELEDGYSFLFKVNGVEMFMKGSNWIPSHILPELTSDTTRVKYLLRSAKDANMNMLRVWGGGVYESDYFYDMADYYGILIWQDMMFACAMYPLYNTFLESVEEETIQNALRIAHHPSIAVWATNNENEAALVENWYGTLNDYDTFASNYRQLYVGTVNHALSIISHFARPEVLISSPSNGRKSNENDFLSPNPQDTHYGDIHYYNYLMDGWDSAMYPKPRFASEYGFQSIPAITSWIQVLHGNDSFTELIDHRQHFPSGSTPIITLIKRHFTLPRENSPDYLEALVYFSQISQAMVTKIETEVYRSQRNTSHNTMGALYWQLNDVWVAPSWSSIDFYGTYKILHYWAKEFLAPLSIIAHVDALKKVNIYVARDTIDENDQSLRVTMKTILWSNLIDEASSNWTFSMQPNTVKLVKTLNLADLFTGTFNKRNCFFEFTLHNSANVVSTTYLFPEKFKNVIGLKDPNIQLVIELQSCRESIKSVSMTTKVQYPAIFVYLELLRTDLSTHTFSKNGFMQLMPIQTIHLEYEDSSCRELKRSDIKVLTVNQFQLS